MKKIQLFDIKQLPYMASLFQSLQFAHAGSVYFGWFGWLIGGVGGVLTNLAIASASSRIDGIAKSRKILATIFYFLLLAISPAAIAPAAYISADAVEWPWVRIMVAVVWAVLPDLSIALTGSIVGKSLVAHDTPKEDTQDGVDAKPTGGTTPAKKRTAPDVRTQCERIADEYACKIPRCGWRPSVDALVAVVENGKNPKQSANSAHGAHSRHYHYQKVNEEVEA